METMVYERGDSAYLINAARMVRTPEALLDAAAATSADWSIDQSNPFISWIAGDFVESDKPNSNTQFWTAGDLELAEYTIRYAPLNMVHKFRQPIGFFAATKSVPLDSMDDETAEAMFADEETDWGKTPSGANAPYKILPDGKKFKVVNNTGETKATFDTKEKALAYLRALYAAVPGAARRANKVKFSGKAKDRISKASADPADRLKIQALSGLWTHIFPFEKVQVEAADEAGLLFYSMECRGTHLTCAGDQGCGQTFDYMAVDTHCEHLQERSSIRHIVNPTFRGGALIVPPVRPGWKEAHASVLTDAVMLEAASFAEQNEQQYNVLNEAGAGLTASAWEQMMALVVASTK